MPIDVLRPDTVSPSAVSPSAVSPSAVSPHDGSPERLSQPVLEIADARKRFGDIEALAGLSLTLAEGEHLGLLGPNGAGKSTLMHAIAGLLALDAGHLELVGGTGRSTDIGFVPQEIALYPRLSTTENLRAFGRIHRLRGAALRQRVAWALEWTGLASRAHTRASELSGGMQRRLNIACGVLHGPRLVLLDEPTVGVDPQGRHRIREMLRELRRGGAALVHSTHELGEIEDLCDRIAIVDHGRTLATGTVDVLVNATLGARAVLHLRFDQPAEDRFPIPAHAVDRCEVRGHILHGELHDVAAELPEFLAAARDAKLGIESVRVQRPTLEAVFTHLTGRGLRE